MKHLKVFFHVTTRFPKFNRNLRNNDFLVAYKNTFFMFTFLPFPFIYMMRNRILYLTTLPFFMNIYIFNKLSLHDIRVLCIINYNDYNFETFFNGCLQNNIEICYRNGSCCCHFIYSKLVFVYKTR